MRGQSTEQDIDMQGSDTLADARENVPAHVPPSLVVDYDVFGDRRFYETGTKD